MTLTSSLNPALLQQAVTFTANVDFTSSYFGIPPGAYQPEGTVTFFDGTTPLGTATLQYSSGATPQQATFTTSQLGAGVHAITVRYNGDAPANLEQFDPATSAVVNETVNGPQTPTTPPVHHRPHHRAHAVTHHHHPTPQVVMHP